MNQFVAYLCFMELFVVSDFFSFFFKFYYIPRTVLLQFGSCVQASKEK